jgi:hypothetical protein
MGRTSAGGNGRSESDGIARAVIGAKVMAAWPEGRQVSPGQAVRPFVGITGELSALSPKLREERVESYARLNRVDRSPDTIGIGKAQKGNADGSWSNRRANREHAAWR